MQFYGKKIENGLDQMSNVMTVEQNIDIFE